MIRPCGPGDEAALDAFLAPHAATSMFLRGNLARFGLAASDHPNATRYWRLPADGTIRAVLGLTNAGVALMQAPGAQSQDIKALTAGLSGQEITGMTGDAAQIAALLGALALPVSAIRADSTEPLYHLALADLQPAAPGALRHARAEDRALLLTWFRQYFRDIGFAPPDPAQEEANLQTRTDAAISGGSHCRLLEIDGQPVAMAGLNARVATMVQVGGVYVPAAARGQGLGRAVTRALLIEARAEGATDAVLFANNPAAARSYEALGFTRIGSYRIVFLGQPITPGPLP